MVSKKLVESSAKLIRAAVPERFRPIGYLTHLSRQRTGSVVRSGPFAGMQYISASHGSAYIPKLLGIYEKELVLQVNEILHAKPGLIIDIGAAEGYYAVGLALQLPEARVVAFEMEASGRTALRQMTVLNRVEKRVKVLEKCEAADLKELVAKDRNNVVICDVEGYESELLNPQRVPGLRSSTILVELHEFLVPGITEILRRRFSPTHEITQIWQEPRSSSEFPWRTLGTSLLPKRYLDWSVSEWRPEKMAWFWMTPSSLKSK